MAATVNVENISIKTSEDEIKSFFSFCGKIQSLDVKPTGEDTQSASVTFEKAAAAKTALLLDNTQLGPNSVQVSSAKSIDEIAGDKSTSAEEAKDGDHHIEQEQKPRARIVAEYLAHGYAISDNVIERALAADKQNGYSTKFMNFINNFDQKTHATQRAQVVDQKLGVSNKGYAAFNMMTSYFDKAASTPTGQKLRAFYDQGNKTVMDVHNEARHLADLKKQKPAGEEPGASTTEGSEKPKETGNEKSGSESYAAAAAPPS
ncbi:RNA-binding protein Vip1 [Decorospora gaudefroyi]|uniref:RNA-binding protein Vip1 n=1 Tax=Decorospora gaudefroyi TaxID=184978 RepID=A0A6A5KN65_9PLEO|nr:RNA-binding protein Vip1 [Decorospora gaudefroyi]